MTLVHVTDWWFVAHGADCAVSADAEQEFLLEAFLAVAAVDVDDAAAARRLEHFLVLVVARLRGVLVVEAAARLGVVVVRRVLVAEVVANRALRRVSLLRSLLGAGFEGGGSSLTIRVLYFNTLL